MRTQSPPPAGSDAASQARPGVRRVNNMPLYLIGGVLLVFVLIMVVVISGRSSDDRARAAAAKGNSGPSAMAMAQQVVGNNGIGTGNGIVPEVATAEPPPPLAVPVAHIDAGDGPPLPPTAEVDPELQRLQQLRLQQLQQALAAKTGVLAAAPQRTAAAPAGAAGGRPPPPSRAATAPRRASQDDLLRAMGGASPGQGGQGGGDPSSSDNSLAQFDTAGGSDRWRLDSAVEMPRTPFTLRAGFVIPAVLISGINSDLPGQIIGQVSQDVYDTATGRHKVIPQGTRLVGAYSSEVAYGQQRVMVAWQRLVFPDGRAMDIGAMPGTDAAGYSGLNDKVNNHFMRIFGQAVLLSAVIAGVELSQDDSSSGFGRPTAGSAMSEALGQTLGQAMIQLFQKNINVSPTLEVRPGYRFNVMVVKDLDFDRPYVPVTY